MPAQSLANLGSTIASSLVPKEKAASASALMFTGLTVALVTFATRKNGGFVGAEALAALREKGEAARIFSLKFDDESAVPLGHEPIYLDGNIVGQTSSTAFGFRVGKPVALGHAHHAIANGARVQVDVARTLFDATLIAGPLLDPEGLRMKV